MRKIAVIDSETDPFKHGRVPKPFIWGFYDGERYYQFGDEEHGAQTDELVEFLEDQDLIVYAHNGGKFDYHFLLDHLIPYDDIKIISGRLAKFKIGVCEFRDSMNIIPVALAEYQKDKIDYDIFEETERYKPDNWKSICDYLESDCVYLYELVTSFIGKYGCHLTQATASMKTWQKMSGKKPPCSNRDYYDFFKSYYYGGRVECFYKGVVEGDFEIIDINSAYPYAMLDEHPFGIEYGVIRDITREHYRCIVGNYFYAVTAISNGAFPFRAASGELQFPSDAQSRNYTITGWELLAALQTKTISADYIITQVIYHFEFCDFADYINHFYEKKKTAKEIDDIKEYIFCKLLMNSLYGKFGSNPDNYSNFLLIPPGSVPMDNIARGHQLKENLSGEYNFSGMLGPWVLASQELDENEKRFYNVATSASITGYVRAYLWKAICQGKDVLYCDTDSIAARSFGGVNFGPELGQWEVEGEFDGGAIGGKKLYAFHNKVFDSAEKEWKIASKGVKLSAGEIYRLCGGEVIEYKPKVPSFSIHSPPKFTNRNIKRV